jgi:hypothetical protein
VRVACFSGRAGFSIVGVEGDAMGTILQNALSRAMIACKIEDYQS